MRLSALGERPDFYFGVLKLEEVSTVNFL